MMVLWIPLSLTLMVICLSERSGLMNGGWILTCGFFLGSSMYLHEKFTALTNRLFTVIYWKLYFIINARQPLCDDWHAGIPTDLVHGLQKTFHTQMLTFSWLFRAVTAETWGKKNCSIFSEQSRHIQVINAFLKTGNLMILLSDHSLPVRFDVIWVTDSVN